MTKKSKVFIVVFIAIILFSGLHIYKRQSENKPIDYKADFYSKTNDMFFALCNTEVYEYVNGNFISSASDITLTANLEKFSIAPDYEGLCLTTNTRKNNDNSHLATDIRATYRGIQLLSGKFEYKEPNFKFYSPSIYDKIIIGDYNLIRDNAEIIYNRNIVYRLIKEFIEMYPDEIKDISQNICVTYNNGYDFTVKAAAAKTFLILLKSYIFDSATCQNIWSNYLTSEYYANPNNSEYYTLEEFKTQYIEGNKSTIQSVFDFMADVINFDVTIHFTTDSKGNIASVSYDDGNSDIRGLIDLTLTPYGNTYNMDGYLSLKIAENIFKIDLFQENARNGALLTTTNNSTLSINNNEHFSFVFNSQLDSKTDSQTMEFNFVSADFELALQCEAKYKALEGDIISIKGEEYSLSDMSIFELSAFANEIQENLLKIKERFN